MSEIGIDSKRYQRLARILIRPVEFRLLRHSVPRARSGKILLGMKETRREYEQNRADFGARRAPPISFKERHTLRPGADRKRQ